LIKSAKASLRFGAAIAYSADAGRQTDLFGVKTHELIALAVQCDGCIAVQTETVLQHRERKQLKQKR